MNYGFKKNIRVFYEGSIEKSGGIISSNKKPKEEKGFFSRSLDFTEGLYTLATDKEARDLAFKTADILSEAEKSTNPTIRKTLELLKATKTVQIGLFDRAKTVARFAEGSGKAGAKAILDAFEKAQKGEISIVLYANNSYTPITMSEYEKSVKNNPEKMNAGVSQGLWDLYIKNNPLGFSKDTWSNISIYCAKKNWQTNIIGSNELMKGGITNLYAERKKEEESKLEDIIKEQLPGIEKNDPRLSELLKKSNLERNPNGTINASKAIEGMNISNATEVPKKFEELALTMKKDAKELFQKAKEIAKSISIKSLSEINIQGIEKGEILNRPFESFNEVEIKKYLPIIQEYSKNIQDPIKKNEIQKVLNILISLNAGFQTIRLAADAKEKERSSRENIRNNPNITPKELGEKLNSQKEQEKAVLAQEVSVSRTSTEQQLDTIKEYGINTLEKAQLKLKELEKKGTLSREEEILKSKLIGYIQSKIQEAQVYQNFGIQLTKDEKREIFTSTNQFVSGNPKETYDFKALEKIAILTDLESTPGQRAFARLEPGKTVSMQKLMEGEMQSSIVSSPEIASMNVTMNTSGGFDIPFLKETNLTKPQVQEYMTNISLYADLGLSQLIPHIPLITAELRNKGINTSIDGSTNTMEQQQVLKEIYGLLFGKKIETNSLGDVERAFVSSAGNPTSMKNAMQHTLKIHHLIGESGQAIAPDTLQKWIRGTQESTPNKADLLANIQ